MITSMTGFGQAKFEQDNLTITVEVKTLNSKFFDLGLKLPKNFSTEKELILRNLSKQTLSRGKCNISLEIKNKIEEGKVANINKSIVKKYYEDIKSIADELEVNESNILRLAMQMPDVISQDLEKEEMSEEEWKSIEDTFKSALEKCLEFRKKEGQVLENALLGYIKNIDNILQEVQNRDPERLINIRKKVQNRIQELQKNDQFDPNRFEQEMIYYIEKLDITEEKVRLKNHLDYFQKTLEQAESNGKKLSFISQEIGREINTIGSKANDAIIQKYVVQMKDELEKIKEQILNVV